MSAGELPPLAICGPKTAVAEMSTVDRKLVRNCLILLLSAKSLVAAIGNPIAVQVLATKQQAVCATVANTPATNTTAKHTDNSVLAATLIREGRAAVS